MTQNSGYDRPRAAEYEPAGGYGPRRAGLDQSTRRLRPGCQYPGGGEYAAQEPQPGYGDYQRQGGGDYEKGRIQQGGSYALKQVVRAGGYDQSSRPGVRTAAIRRAGLRQQPDTSRAATSRAPTTRVTGRGATPARDTARAGTEQNYGQQQGYGQAPRYDQGYGQATAGRGYDQRGYAAQGHTSRATPTRAVRSRTAYGEQRHTVSGRRVRLRPATAAGAPACGRLLGHAGPRRRQRPHVPATRGQQHHRSRPGRPVPAPRHRGLAPAHRDPLGRTVAMLSDLDPPTGHRQRCRRTGLAARRRRWHRAGHSEILIRIV